MSKLKGLIKKYCPRGVEYRELREICFFQNGYSFKSNLFRNKGDFPIIRIQNIQNNNINDNKI